MSDALKLLALAFQTRTKLCFDEHMLLVVPGKNLPEGALKRFYAAQNELAKLVFACISFELTPEEQEEIGREMLEAHLEEEAAELAARGICPTCRGTGVATDSDGIPDEVCTDCYEYRHRSPDDSESLGDSAPLEGLERENAGVVPAIGGPTSAFADPDVDGKPSPSPEDS